MRWLQSAVEPYAVLVRMALWALLVGGLFVAGCRHGEKVAAKDAAEQVADAQREAADNLAAANACGQALSDVSEETRLAERRAAEYKAAAAVADAQAAAASAEAKARAAAAANALEAAKATPTCAAQLAMTLCPEIPLL